VTDTTWATTLGATDRLSDSRGDLNANFAAGRLLSVRAEATAYTAADDDVILCDASGGAFSVTLPAVAGSTGHVYTIKKTDVSANAVTIDGDASETIDGATTLALSAQYDFATIICDGSEWHVIGTN
jgi:hypothetical protein